MIGSLSSHRNRRPRAAGLSLFCGWLALVTAAWAAAADCVRPQVLRVHDGDTVSLSCAQRTIKLRLADVDAPEIAQAYGPEARGMLQRLLTARHIQVQTRARDRYGREIGDVLVDGQSVSLRLVEQGLAWCGPRAAAACTTRQQQARRQRAGLWQQDDPMPPWQWRRQHPRKD